MVSLNVNTIYLQNGMTFRITVPTEHIPDDIKEEYMKQIEKVEKYRLELKEQNLTIQEIKEKIKQFKIDNKILDIFMFFVNIGENINLIHFKLGNNKMDYLDNKEKKVSTTSEIINDFVKEFEKFGLEKVTLMPFQPKSSGAELSDELKKDYEEKIETYEEVITMLARLMIVEKANMKKYEDNFNPFFDAFLRLDGEETNILSEKIASIKQDTKFINEIKEIWKKQKGGN